MKKTLFALAITAFIGIHANASESIPTAPGFVSDMQVSSGCQNDQLDISYASDAELRARANQDVFAAGGGDVDAVFKSLKAEAACHRAQHIYTTCDIQGSLVADSDSDLRKRAQFEEVSGGANFGDDRIFKRLKEQQKCQQAEDQALFKKEADDWKQVVEETKVELLKRAQAAETLGGMGVN